MVKKLARCITALAVGVVLTVRPCTAAEPEVALSASFILNVLNFSPDLVGQSSDQPLTIVVAGSKDYSDELRSIFEGRAVLSHPIKIDAGPWAEEKGANVLVFAPTMADKEISSALSLLKGPVLTISSAPGFASAGGAIEFHVVGDRVKFRVNRRTLQLAKISISSRVLVLAEEIIQ
jgi:hypothetical protein